MAVFDNMNGTYSAGVAPEVTKYFDRVLLKEAEANLVHQKDLQKRVLPPKSGNMVNFRKFHPWAPDDTPLKEGITPDGQKINVSEIHCAVKPYGKHVEFTDELDLTTIDNNVQEAARLLSQQANETLDLVAANALNSGLNVIYVDATNGTNTSRSDIVAGTDVLTAAAIKRAVRMLEKNNAKRFPDGFYHAIVDPETKYDLTADPLWVDIAKYQNEGKAERYELGKMMGVKFYETTLTKVFKYNDALYVDAGTPVTNLALNGGAWTVADQKGYVTIAKTTAYATGTDADYEYWCRRMSGKLVRILDSSASTYMNALIDRAEVDGSNLKLTLRYLDTASNFAYASGDKIYATAGGASNCEVHSTIVYGQDFAGAVELGNGGGTIQSILNNPGSSGAADPLAQRGTIAWKVKGYAATILQDGYGVRLEHSVSA